ncbi:hypothetical protein BU26DRAFT_11772 [Trematosphaeria pertusa]|uniref:Uncharacterized protein n=1 Tax=Trematosphaeria pertusa TaxID=390896 RepID=A0A6A6J170_9PLEO|nr:uncharacterized protein BU26DRAFT_11772 [Trematosphaeria pertusa]KAF2255922.1 hypothetical protein BU26DRAFT_11772 [Trematosphaeria pertusa]
MDPSRNSALQDAKIQSLLPTLQQQLQQFQRQQQEQANSDSAERTPGSEDMPPPPAYHMVVDPAAPIPNLHNPYDADDEEKDDDDTPEVNINATTQIRGHGNIISIAQMDSVRIANLVAILLHGGIPPTVPLAQAAAQAAHQPAGYREPPRHRPLRRDPRHFPNININVNCGATVIGDRNIVGPGLGDIARHMQMAQRSQAAQQQQQGQTSPPNQRAGCAQNPGLGFSVGAQGPMATPPMSRTSSFGSEGSNKRKAEEGVGERPAKREC